MKDKYYKNSVSPSPKKMRATSSVSSPNYKVHWIVLFGIVIFISAIYYLGFSTPSSYKDKSETFSIKTIPNLNDQALHALDPQQFSYVVVIDAGSSGCRAHVYRYGKLGSSSGPLYILPRHDSKKLKPGLSSFSGQPELAGPSLASLIQFVKGKVPENYWKDTPIWLKATAGLRLLDKTASDKILESVRVFLKDPSNCPFHFKPHYANLISGWFNIFIYLFIYLFE